MIWFSVLPSMAVCLMVLFFPGALMLSALGRTGIARWAPAPLMTAALVGFVGIVAGALRLPWNLGTLVVFGLLVAAILWFSCRFLATTRYPLFAKPKSLRPNLGTILGVGLGALVQLWILAKALVNPESIAQRFDNVFHLNAIQWIVDTQNASSLTLNLMIGVDGPVGIYPSVWHSVAALLVQATSISVPAAANVLNLVVGGVIWPLGCVFLARTVLGPGFAHQVVAGVSAASFAAFPLALLDFGPLYPNLLSYSLVPIALAVLVAIFKSDATASLDWLRIVVPVGAIFVALMLSQPNGLVTLLVLALPLLISQWAKRLVQLTSTSENLAPLLRHWALLAVAAAFALVLWNFLRPNDPTGGWAPIQTAGPALGESLLNGPMGRLPAWTMTLLIILGLFVAAQRSKLRWVAGSYVIAIALFVVAASAPAGAMRSWFTGGWYNDSYRLAAILPLIAVLLAAVGADAMARTPGELAKRLVSKSTLARQRATSAGYACLSVILVGAVLVGVNYSAVPPALQGASDAHTDGPESPLLSSDEYDLLRRLPQEVSEDSVVAVNPWNGGALAYAVSGTQVSLRHLITEIPPGIDAINRTINVSPPGSPACVAAKELNIRYVLDFGQNTFLNSFTGQEFAGLRADRGSNLRIVDSQGAASLLEIVGC